MGERVKAKINIHLQGNAMNEKGSEHKQQKKEGICEVSVCHGMSLQNEHPIVVYLGSTYVTLVTFPSMISEFESMAATRPSGLHWSKGCTTMGILGLNTTSAWSPASI